MDLHYLISTDTDHVAKFRCNWTRELGDPIGEFKKTSRVKQKGGSNKQNPTIYIVLYCIYPLLVSHTYLSHRGICVESHDGFHSLPKLVGKQPLNPHYHTVNKQTSSHQSTILTDAFLLTCCSAGVSRSLKLCSLSQQYHHRDIINNNKSKSMSNSDNNDNCFMVLSSR